MLDGLPRLCDACICQRARPTADNNMRPLSHAFLSLDGRGGSSTRSAADNGLLRFRTVFLDGGNGVLCTESRPGRWSDGRAVPDAKAEFNSLRCHHQKASSIVRARMTQANGVESPALKNDRLPRKGKPEKTGDCRGPAWKGKPAGPLNDSLNGDIGRQGRACGVRQPLSKSSGFNEEFSGIRLRTIIEKQGVSPNPCIRRLMGKINGY